MTLQIFNSVDFIKAQKSRYLENETYFLQIKKIFNYASTATLWGKILLAEIQDNSRQKTVVLLIEMKLL